MQYVVLIIWNSFRFQGHVMQVPQNSGLEPTSGWIEAQVCYFSHVRRFMFRKNLIHTLRTGIDTSDVIQV